MSAPRPDSLVWRGSVEAAGLLVADTPAQRAALLRSLGPGDTVLGCDAGLVLRFAAPRRVDTAVAAGLPLCELHGRLCGFPWKREALDALRAPLGALVFARGGKIVVVPAPHLVDPARWLGTDGWAVVAPLEAPPPPAPRLVPQAPPPVALRAFLREAPPPRPVDPPLRALWRALREWWRSRRPEPGRMATTARAPSPARRTISESLWRRLVRAIQESSLGERLRQRQQDYLSRLNELFERGDLDQALREAIALADRDERRGGADPTPALGVPRPRDALVPSTSRAGPGPTMTLGDDYERLRRQYQAAADELVRQGRIEEAAFVHADLLKQPQVAVSLLDQHRKYALAAQVADAHDLDAALRVRLWVLAGDLPRAVALARRGHWTVAATLLQRDRPDLANALRLAHADTLASAGDYAGAVTVAAPLRGAEGLARRWAELGVAAGGPGAAQLLVRQLELSPERGAQTVEQARALLASDGPAELDSRRALADALAHGPESTADARAALARVAVRAVLRDQAVLGAPAQALLTPLLGLDDGALRADVPTQAGGAPPTQLATRLVFEADPTAPEAFDAVALGGGRVAIACGELGVRVVGADGRQRAQFPAPAHRLSGRGNALLALARRAPHLALTKLSLAPSQAAHWAHVALSVVDAEVHDGLWFAAEGDVLLGLDTLAPEPTALHRLALDGRVAAIASSRDQLALLVEAPNLTSQLLLYGLPTVTPRPRQLAWNAAGLVSAASVTPEGTVAIVGAAFDGTPMLWHGAPRQGAPPGRVLPAPAAGAPAPRAELVAVPLRLEAGVEVRLLRATQGAPLTTWFFPGATRVSVRWCDDWLCAAASTGRVVCLHFPTRKVWTLPTGGPR